MNYFAHGHRFVSAPYFLAGTAVPDLLSAFDRKVRTRSHLAEPFLDDEDSTVSAIARGITQHHFDDRWFHQTRAFAELSMEFTIQIRDHLPPDKGFRPSFLGHILVELLLDNVLIQREPERLDAYYDAMKSIAPARLEDTVNRMATRPTKTLAKAIPFFISERFLYDYADDRLLWYRLNLVMRRVGLAVLSEKFIDLLPNARKKIEERADELLCSD